MKQHWQTDEEVKSVLEIIIIILKDVSCLRPFHWNPSETNRNQSRSEDPNHHRVLWKPVQILNWNPLQTIKHLLQSRFLNPAESLSGFCFWSQVKLTWRLWRHGGLTLQVLDSPVWDWTSVLNPVHPWCLKSSLVPFLMSVFTAGALVVSPGESRAPLPLPRRWHGDDRWAATGVCPTGTGRNGAKRALFSQFKVGLWLRGSGLLPGRGLSRSEQVKTGRITRQLGSEGERKVWRQERGNWQLNRPQTAEKVQKGDWSHLISHDSLRDGTPRRCVLISLFVAEQQVEEVLSYWNSAEILCDK